MLTVTGSLKGGLYSSGAQHYEDDHSRNHDSPIFHHAYNY